MRSYTFYCGFRGLRPALPATVPNLLAWLAKLGDDRLQASSIKKYLSGLKSHHVDIGCYRRDIDDVFSHGQVERLYRGIKLSQYTDDRPRKPPITKNVLLSILRTLDTSTIDGANFHTAFCLAFAGFLRIGEFTYEPGDTRYQDFKDYHVTRRSITFSANSICLHLPASKTDPFRHGVTIPIAATDREACPLQSLQNLYKIDPQDLDHPLFKVDDKSTRRTVNTKLIECFATAPLFRRPHTGVSFRAGAATEAKRAGMPDSDIQLLGRWKSDVFIRYIHSNESMVLNTSRRFQRASPE